MSARTLVTTHGVNAHPDDAAIQAAFRACEHDGFWLDLADPDGADEALLARGLGFHPLTIDDIQRRHQRPKFEDYGRYSFVVLFGCRREGSELHFTEHYLYVAPNYCISVRHESSADLDELLERLRQNGQPEEATNQPPRYAYLVMDQVVDGMFAVLDELDADVDALLDGIIAGQTRDQMAAITGFSHQIRDLRRVLGAQHDLFQRLVSHVVTAGHEEISHYYRDVYDHVIRQYDMVDSLRDLLSSAMDVYLSSVSNRLNATVKTLTVIASVFLPLTFLTGFFGMNFELLVKGISSPLALFVGVGVMALSVVVQLALFKRRRWI